MSKPGRRPRRKGLFATRLNYLFCLYNSIQGKSYVIYFENIFFILDLKPEKQNAKSTHPPTQVFALDITWNLMVATFPCLWVRGQIQHVRLFFLCYHPEISLCRFPSWRLRHLAGPDNLICLNGHLNTGSDHFWNNSTDLQTTNKLKLWKQFDRHKNNKQTETLGTIRPT